MRQYGRTMISLIVRIVRFPKHTKCFTVFPLSPSYLAADCFKMFVSRALSMLILLGSIIGETIKNHYHTTNDLQNLIRA